MTTVSRPTKPRTAWRLWLIAAVLAAITWLTWHDVGGNLTDIVANWRNGADKIIALTQPDYAFFPHTVGPLLETLRMAVIATAVSAAIAFPLSFLASRATNPSGPLLGTVRTVMNVARAIPDLLSAAVLVSMVGIGALPGILALILFDVAIVVKLISEALDAADLGPQEAAIATGATYLEANRAAIVPAIVPAFIAQTLYVLELNVRASSVLGLVGAGGLGMLIDEVRSFYRYHQLSLIILEILIVVVVIETVSTMVRKRLLA
ncbi:phosphonate ABC transporter, permease protein PhnE [Nocardia camponoti]|uniref:ABC transporter permease n=1 Tax=Nocardia camponoti TaxID=1616106 RepID=A0A917QTB3_9NOCA|nr:phosphonate ABC transporter, permease protein PhnE [Nocardia camponoti]GGK67246.1 ABC transporter permease [Nocardia camponoti]